MRASKMAEPSTSESDFYRDFMRLDRDRRRRIAVRILRNEKMLADLYDHFLIRRTLDEPGQNLAWEFYSRARDSER
jgi:hypothetical protein